MCVSVGDWIATKWNMEIDKFPLNSFPILTARQSLPVHIIDTNLNFSPDQFNFFDCHRSNLLFVWLRMDFRLTITSNKTTISFGCYVSVCVSVSIDEAEWAAIKFDNISKDTFYDCQSQQRLWWSSLTENPLRCDCSAVTQQKENQRANERTINSILLFYFAATLNWVSQWYLRLNRIQCDICTIQDIKYR